MKLHNLLARNRQILGEKAYLFQLWSNGKEILKYRVEKKRFIAGFDDMGGSNSAILTLIAKEENYHEETRIYLDRDGEGWKHYRTETIEMTKVADITTIDEKETSIGISDGNGYARNISEFDNARLEKLKAKIKVVLPEIEVHDIGRYLAPATYNRYCILHTNRGAHIYLAEGNSIWKINRWIG